MPSRFFLLILFASIGLLGCQAKPVLPVPPINPSVLAVQQDSDRYKDHVITWGGVILSTQNSPKYSEVVIISKRLTSSTRPIESDQTPGRFIAKVEGFLDPAVYAKGRELTVHGTVSGSETRKIDNYNYTYPVINVINYYLWPAPVNYNDDFDDYWYGPWYYPYPHHHYHSNKRLLKVN